jgi:hypothetical protein
VSLETEPGHGSNLLEDFSTAIQIYAMLILKYKVSRVKLGTSRTVLSEKILSKKYSYYPAPKKCNKRVVNSSTSYC